MFFVFCVFIVPIIVFVILHLMTREKTDNDMQKTEPMEMCAFCQNDFPINQLLEKEVGTYGRIYCFCRECVEGLYNEFNNIGVKTGE
ncbi:hypothetical protein F4212_15265 [Candidatus Poribacteria bacterium]|nr:hypothetical protein [Candidatus Poribacteria bacterium]